MAPSDAECEGGGATAQVRNAGRDRVAALASCGLLVAVLAVLSLVALPLPFSPVPVTLQTLGVFLAGGLLGPRWGSLAVFVYVLMGAAGVPVFAGGEAGIGALLGPKGGYLLGFVPATFVIGLTAAQARHMASKWSACVLSLGMSLGICIIDACGVGWLSLVTGLGLAMSFAVGALPFLPGDILKLVAAVVLVRSLWRAVPSLLT